MPSWDGTTNPCTESGWTCSGDANWSSDGSKWVSGVITHNEVSTLEYTGEFASTSDNVSFDWGVSSEQSFDFLSWYVDDVLQDQISGSVGLTTVTATVSAGSHTIKFEYTKDGSVSNNDDNGFIDNVEFIADDNSSSSSSNTPSSGSTSSSSNTPSTSTSDSTPSTESTSSSSPNEQSTSSSSVSSDTSKSTPSSITSPSTESSVSSSSDSTSSTSESSTSSTSSTSTASTSSDSTESDSSQSTSSESTNTTSSASTQSESSVSTSSEPSQSELSGSTSSASIVSESSGSTSSESTQSELSGSSSSESTGSTSSQTSGSTSSDSTSSSSNSPLRVYPPFDPTLCRALFDRYCLAPDNVYTQEWDIIDNVLHSTETALSLGIDPATMSDIDQNIIFYEWTDVRPSKAHPYVIVKHNGNEFPHTGAGQVDGGIMTSNWEFELHWPVHGKECSTADRWIFTKAMHGFFYVLFKNLRHDRPYLRDGGDSVGTTVQTENELVLSGDVEFIHGYCRDDYTVNAIGNCGEGNTVPVLNKQIRHLSVSLDGTGGEVDIGLAANSPVSFNATIFEWRLSAEQSGSIEVDVQVTNDGTTPDSSDSIVDNNYPKLDAQSYAFDTSLSDWASVRLSPGSRIRFEVLTNSGIENAVLVLGIRVA